ncbi:MAG: hypothetical protein CL878_09210 [Dehalococcoidia bacterium]|nr:hypothetical protein [Dehalococcoidia bacterium]
MLRRLLARRRHLVGLSLSLLALVLVACGGSEAGGSKSSGGAASGPKTVSMTMLDEMKFVPSTVNVERGQTVTLNLTNKGLIIHDLEVRGLDREVKAVVEAGKEATVTFTAPSEAGDYAYVCVQPGHEDAGMKGILRVK